MENAWKKIILKKWIAYSSVWWREKLNEKNVTALRNCCIPFADVQCLKSSCLYMAHFTIALDGRIKWFPLVFSRMFEILFVCFLCLSKKKEDTMKFGDISTECCFLRTWNGMSVYQNFYKYLSDRLIIYYFYFLKIIL